ncbi:GH1 family beta-glucosidase [Terracoccus luteus]|uniref:Beta-glucosidase n=1 Tax=Terracoccus luteus TaxID=53356 RepID=A0A839Q1Z2_9MICO|nr:GH1 family beta-glucosidase [Terracoccus luteus]MBB2988286.1 beta-glucosidase [Terracoccus luteus]MCP2173921.1 beta-glucosidase [Terracoccus luteus]
MTSNLTDTRTGRSSGSGRTDGGLAVAAVAAAPTGLDLAGLTSATDAGAPGGRAFPPGFVLGAATAAYQIEGAARVDGRTPSIWDTFSHTPGAVVDGDTGDVACDHHARFEQDVELMARLGLQSYRFSTSWGRVCPDGGPVNARGLDFYDRLVDSLVEHDVAPWLTLYHWDLPQALEDRGGWTSRESAERFVEYALAVHDRLGDRVSTWTTLNEPWCSAFLGYTAGVHAPGRTSPADGLAAAHHLLLGHGLAVRALRERDPSLSLGLTLNFTVADPVDPTDPRDLDAVRRVDGQMNRIFAEPVLLGRYPADVLDDVRGLGLEHHILDADLEVISTPIDVLGVNYYNGEAVGHTEPEVLVDGQADPGRPTRSPFPAAEAAYRHPRGLPVTAMDWEIQPDGLTRLLTRLHTDYVADYARGCGRGRAVRMSVTENGAAFDDEADATGFVDDTRRVAYLRAHLGAVLDAVDAGVPVHGFFYWSLLDNFEWAWGYAKRFGIVRVDYETQVRTPKASALDYARIIATRRLPAGDEQP